MATYPSSPGAPGDRPFERERAPAPASSEPTIAELLGGVIGDAQALMHREIDLAKQEVTNELNKAKQGAISLGAGAGVAIIGVLLLSHMLVYALHEGLSLSLWLSYLIVGGLFAIIGGALLYTGVSRMKTVDPVPRETIESVRKDVTWITQQNPSDKT